MLGPFDVPSVEEVLASDHESDWLKRSVAELSEQDPDEAIQQAYELYVILKYRPEATE
ncbi:hypothetical protein [uncultured Tateyamaria sp.]|uniref:hypothetical protein n=1 Tax=uncultured Tateyamaria sp. TaxID=455651 RepID=UPI0026279FF0|nr:hypothetical protein [uncultured Tateyamaria sp.]